MKARPSPYAGRIGSSPEIFKRMLAFITLAMAVLLVTFVVWRVVVRTSARHQVAAARDVVAEQRKMEAAAVHLLADIERIEDEEHRRLERAYALAMRSQYRQRVFQAESFIAAAEVWMSDVGWLFSLDRPVFLLAP